MEALELARRIVDVIEDKKGSEIVLLDLRPDTVIADFFVLCNGTSDRQLRALADYVQDDVEEKYGRKPFAVNGTPDSGWVLLDYGDVVVHLFAADKRAFYDLEGLWRQKAKPLLSIQ